MASASSLDTASAAAYSVELAASASAYACLATSTSASACLAASASASSDPSVGYSDSCESSSSVVEAVSLLADSPPETVSYSSCSFGGLDSSALSPLSIGAGGFGHSSSVGSVVF